MLAPQTGSATFKPPVMRLRLSDRRRFFKCVCAAMVSDRPIEITLLPERQRGPGRHWLSYRAVFCDDPNGLVGYGTTLREARLDLQKQSARSDVRAFASARGTGGTVEGAGLDA
jgi:hypothetical protein